MFGLLIESIEVVHREKYAHKMEEAEEIIGEVDEKDVPFVALALSVPNDGIWSDDEHFKKQGAIRTWSTTEIINLEREL